MSEFKLDTQGKSHNLLGGFTNSVFFPTFSLGGSKRQLRFPTFLGVPTTNCRHFFRSRSISGSGHRHWSHQRGDAESVHTPGVDPTEAGAWTLRPPLKMGPQLWWKGPSSGSHIRETISRKFAKCPRKPGVRANFLEKFLEMVSRTRVK